VSGLAPASLRPAAPTDHRPPAAYWWWVAAITVSLVGSQVQAFAISWSATAQGGRLAAVVFSMISGSQLLLVLFGGAVADRRGPWLVMVTSDAGMLVATLALALGVWALGIQPWLLMAAALLVGVSSAFYLPAAGAMPRLLTSGPGLGRALAARQSLGQLAAVIGAPLGGLVVVSVGLGGAAVLNALSFAVILAMLVLLRGSLARSTRGESAEVPAEARVLDGLRAVMRDPLLRNLFGLVAVAAIALLPVPALLVPLLVRQQHWGAEAAGHIVGAQALGVGIVTVVVLVRGIGDRPGRTLAIGVLLCGLGVIALSGVTGQLAATAIGLVMGLGLGLFGSHVAPLVLATSAASHVSRTQSVLILVQSVPALISVNVDGSLADAVGSRAVLLVAGSLAATGGLVALFRADIRHARLPH
jgi:MFS family permease